MLLRLSAEPTVFDAEMVNDLREQANEAFAHFTDRLDGNTLFITKHTLASVHDCEVHFFSLPTTSKWTPARARGQGRAQGDPADAELAG